MSPSRQRALTQQFELATVATASRTEHLCRQAATTRRYPRPLVKEAQPLCLPVHLTIRRSSCLEHQAVPRLAWALPSYAS
jgi:hypothetical protein